MFSWKCITKMTEYWRIKQERIVEIIIKPNQWLYNISIFYDKNYKQDTTKTLKKEDVIKRINFILNSLC